ncbi:hypothetical protein H0Z60_05125 [Ectothiorhodospiraceae bacterium WFHF3C12]|nr:hypothetical protein [Ectothiorhodospiraceae bacterium WFHF3C12]
MLGRLRTLIALALAVLSSTSGAAPAPAAELHYRAVLFDFYQDDYFNASTRSLAYEDQKVLGERRRDAELLRGGMFLSYGLFDAAAGTFRELLDDALAPSVRQRAWYHLGRLAYQRNDLETAEDALERVGDDASVRRGNQRDLLLGLIAMRRGDHEGALRRLSAGESGEQTSWYAVYNMGIAALRAGERDRGRALLMDIAELDVADSELLALRDRASIALGFHALAAGDAAGAAPMFDRVRITGPFATQALLGAGWAASSDGAHRRALVSWRALMERDITAPAVQEAYLAAPHGLLQLGAEREAAQAYRDGIEAYARELGRLRRAIESVRSGEMVRRLRVASMRSRGEEWPLQVMRETPGGEYLPELLAGHDFQRAAANFRDLYALRRHLNYWAESMDGFGRMLETRRRRYENNVTRVEQAMAELDLEALQARREALAGRVERIAATEDALALATTDERRRLEQLDELERRLDALPAQEREPLAQRRHVLAGFQRWRIATDFAPRLWEARKALGALDERIAELREQRRSLIRARSSARQRFQGFAERIRLARARVATLLPRVNDAIERQRDRLETLAEAALVEREQRLRGYLAQARFALAQLHDRARNRRTSGDAQ